MYVSSHRQLGCLYLENEYLDICIEWYNGCILSVEEIGTILDDAWLIFQEVVIYSESYS